MKSLASRAAGIPVRALSSFPPSLQTITLQSPLAYSRVASRTSMTPWFTTVSRRSLLAAGAVAMMGAEWGGGRERAPRTGSSRGRSKPEPVSVKVSEAISRRLRNSTLNCGTNSFRASGNPRRINRLCDLALLIGFAEEQVRINTHQIEAVSNELVTIAPE